MGLGSNGEWSGGDTEVGATQAEAVVLGGQTTLSDRIATNGTGCRRGRGERTGQGSRNGIGQHKARGAVGQGRIRGTVHAALCSNRNRERSGGDAQ